MKGKEINTRKRKWNMLFKKKKKKSKGIIYSAQDQHRSLYFQI